MEPAQGLGVATFEERYLAGVARADAGDFLGAARLWYEAEELLTAEEKDNRSSLFDDVADAYEKAVATTPRPAFVAEAVRTLDALAAAFTRVHPNGKLHDKGTAAHARLRARLDSLLSDPVRVQPETKATGGSGDDPSPAAASMSGAQAGTSGFGDNRLQIPAAVTAPGAQARTDGIGDQPSISTTGGVRRPWKGLMIGGGISTGLGLTALGMFVGGYVRAHGAQQDFDAAGSGCSGDMLEGECKDFYDLGSRTDVVATIGVIAAPVLVTAGVTMIIIAARRKVGTTRISPVVSPSMVGLTLSRRF